MPPQLESSACWLTEAAVVERLKRSTAVQLHPELVHAGLVLDESGRAALANIYREYLDIAASARLPMLLLTPTWRANRDRLAAAGLGMDLNQQACSFMRELCAAHAGHGSNGSTLLAGLIGCRGDAYQPEEGLSVEESRDFHRWQLDQLVAGGCDLLIAETLPALPEALGIAQAMRDCGLPFIISFVTGRDGRLLDGNTLDEAIHQIDEATESAARGYMINCAWPSHLKPEHLSTAAKERLIGMQANGSSLDPAELDASTEWRMEAVEDWTKAMLDLRDALELRILGGCCGTDGRHLKQMAKAIRQSPQTPDRN